MRRRSTKKKRKGKKSTRKKKKKSKRVSLGDLLTAAQREGMSEAERSEHAARILKERSDRRKERRKRRSKKKSRRAASGAAELAGAGLDDDKPVQLNPNDYVDDLD